MQDITPGKILFSKPSVTGENAPEQHAEYKPADLREPNLKLRTGDKVEFSFAVGDGIAEDETQARDITLVARAASAAASGGRQLGCIVAAKEGFGFIRCLPYGLLFPPSARKKKELVCLVCKHFGLAYLLI